MDEKSVKAPVTRRRRKMSTDQPDDEKISPAANTPTKRRPSRRTAKPELELIDENDNNNQSKLGNKTALVKDIIESVEDKPLTPSRRSARIKSNTSIISESEQNYSSPRAMRAAKRYSLNCSDNETTLTPVKHTRRTRKDSTSSIEKQVETKATNQFPEVIAEEPENVTQTSNKSYNRDSQNNSNSLQKSPDLKRRSPRVSNPQVPEDDKIGLINDENAQKNKSDVNENQFANNLTASGDDTSEYKLNTNISDKKRLSVSSSNLLTELVNNPKKNSSHNRSLTEGKDRKRHEVKRKRTKSWTTSNLSPQSNKDFHSDNENKKSKIKNKSGITLLLQSDNGSGDQKLSNCNHISTERENIESKCEYSSLPNDTITHKLSKNFQSYEGNGVTYDLTENKENDEIINFFQKQPSSNIQAVVLMEDSDSNSQNMKIQHQKNNEDQCVPVIHHPIEKKTDNPPELTTFETTKNVIDSCEPMDVDETIPDTFFNGAEIKEKETGDQKTSLDYSHGNNNRSVKEHNISKRKSSIKPDSSQFLEKVDNENKSTLVLAQFKDLSSAENSVSKSPQFINNKLLSKSVNALDVTQENSEVNDKMSNCYSTSTPLQHKSNIKILEKNDSLAKVQNNASETEVRNVIINEISATNNSDVEEDSDLDSDESSRKKSNYLDDEAEEASDNYKSGDSQDEEEKRYIKDNEIVERGETLTSEDNLSNDSDYEKDSFLVSSDEEDNDLLSGSGDDLSMSDNELKMTAKSKKKYNERKLKEQKKASREMYEARHKLGDSLKNSSLPNTKAKKNIYDFESSQSEDDIIFVKKNSRTRLDSSIDISTTKSNDQESIIEKKKNVKGLSESSCKDNELIQKERTVCMIDDNTFTNDPPSINEKLKPKTPLKNDRKSVEFVNTEDLDDTSDIDKTARLNKSKDPIESGHVTYTSSLSSEDENIAQSYDNVLQELNKTNNNKKCSVSLNFEKKSKSNSEIKLIDHLNITKPKISKRENQNNSSSNTSDSEMSDDLEDKSCNGSIIKFEKENNSILNNLNLSQREKMVATERQELKEEHNANRSKLNNRSLNLMKKEKKSNKEPIVDHLNLTQIKDTYTLPKKNKNQEEVKQMKEVTDKSDGSSDSIDLKLLFSEDSNQSEDLNKKRKQEEATDKITEDLIPLKKSEAVTDIRTFKGIKSKEEYNLPFFIDTVGTQSDSSSDEMEEQCATVQKTTTNYEAITSRYNTSKSENKDKSDSISQLEKSLNKSLHRTSQSEERRKNNISQMQFVDQLDFNHTDDKTLDNTKTNKTPSSRERKDSDLSTSQNKSINISINKTPMGKMKKTKKQVTSPKPLQKDDDSITENAAEQSINKSKHETSINEKKKKKNTPALQNISQSDAIDIYDIVTENTNETAPIKKRKREMSLDSTNEELSEVEPNEPTNINIQKKKKTFQVIGDIDKQEQGTDITPNATVQNISINNKEKETIVSNESSSSLNSKKKNRKGTLSNNQKPAITVNKNKKRKHREDDDGASVSKVLKESSFDEIYIHRLPSSLLKQLDDKPKKEEPIKRKNRVISTTQFIVEENKKRKNKPSNYLEESILLNRRESPTTKKQTRKFKKPKVLPFIPTALTSSSGFTSTFKVNVLPQETNFLAQSNNMESFKDDQLYGKKIKRVGTYEFYKRNRNIKMSKF